MNGRISSIDFRGRFVELLPNADADEYSRLRHLFTDSRFSLSDILTRLRWFCVRNDENDRDRCMACGVCWLSGDQIAFSMRTILPFIDRSKSWFKNAIQRLGYVAIPNFSCELMNRIPGIEQNPTLLREWGVYALKTATPIPEMPNLEGLVAIECPASPMPEALYEILSVADLRKKEMKARLEEFFDDPFCCAPNCLFDEFEYHICG
jgi:hypothetical protein